jgi:nanoRNase/pAp phosphatase (c-di-AMP/oligoRNAs hydrolase)
MTSKTPVTGALWKQNLSQTITLINNHQRFLFTGYVDGDALGTMLSLALYLRLLDKKVSLFLPHSLGTNFNFVRDIINHNEVEVVNDAPGLRAIHGKVDTIVFCDTANAQLISHFDTISQCFLECQVPVIEIDHHFGTDSEALSLHGIRLFRKANACTEIAAEILQEVHQHHPEFPNPFIQRNILLSLLIGMVTDTAGGKVTPLKDDYSYWIQMLGENLKNGTFRASRVAQDSPPDKKISTPEDLLAHLHQMTPEQKQCIQSLLERMECVGEIGYLNLLETTPRDWGGADPTQDLAWFNTLQECVISLVPQRAGKIGILLYRDRDAHGTPCIFLKIRQSPSSNEGDLRKIEPVVQSIFGGKNYLGGGGHPGAVSFRIRPISEDQTLEGIRELIPSLQKISNSS